MQPYFFPHLGYFQLINCVDEFVIYDNIEYTKKGWINRNRIRYNDTEKTISVPIQKDSDYLNIIDRAISPDWEKHRYKILGLINSSYRKAPFFEVVYDIVQGCLLDNEMNLFRFLFNTIKRINKYLEIDTPIIISSNIDIDHSLRSQDKVLAICKKRKANTYINSIGGIDLYNKEDFKDNGIDLFFIQSDPSFSIIDTMMFNSKDQIRSMLKSNELVRGK